MRIEKSEVGVSGNRIQIGVSFTKVDTEKRIVSGFATLNNKDQHGDIIPPSASEAAFSSFRGNIREMHQPVAVGKLLNFYSDTYYDPESGRAYEGIYTSVYVSRGAENTWIKVLDGTLSGFSIGGAFEPQDVEYKMIDGEETRVINKYRLTELSLVDNPANQFANIMSIAKFNDGTIDTVKSVTASRVFYCPEDIIALTRSDDTANCPACDTEMNVIGEFNSEDVDVAKFVFTSISEQNTVKLEKNEGGVIMTDANVTEKSEETVDEVAVETVEKAEGTAEAVTEVEDADATTEVTKSEEEVDEAPSFDLEKALDDVRDSVAAAQAETADIVKALEDKTAERLEEVQKRFDEVFSTLEGLNKDLGTLTERHDSIAKRVDGVESSYALKKSADVELEKANTEDTFWGGQLFRV